VIKKKYFPTVKVQKNNGSNPSTGKDYYVSKGGNFKVKKYIEAGQTVEDYDKKYLVENVRTRGINVGRSKLIEVQSKTDNYEKLLNKLKNLQKEYGNNIVKDYKVEKPKGGK